MAGSYGKFEWKDGTIVTNLQKLPGRLDNLVRSVVEYYGSRGPAYMRKNAKWRDRTTNARNGLHTVTFHTANQHGIIYAHGVNYGIWLEVRFAGRYAIIMPTINDQGPRVMAMLEKGMGRISSS